jgi:hypothetical protein
VEPGPLGRAIPVDFSPPADSLVTDHDNPSDQVLWLLHAQADVPGVDYSDDFEVPVFRNAASAEPASDSGTRTTTGADGFGFAAPQASDADSGAVPQPTHTKVVVSMGSGGTEFCFPALRNPSRALMLFLVLLVWTGVAYLLYQKHAPIFFFILFGLSDLIVIAGFLHVTFGSARICVRSGEILSRTGIFGLGRTRRMPVSDVASIVPVVSMQQGNSSGNALNSRCPTARFGLATCGLQISRGSWPHSARELRWTIRWSWLLSGGSTQFRVTPPRLGLFFPN